MSLSSGGSSFGSEDERGLWRLHIMFVMRIRFGNATNINPICENVYYNIVSAQHMVVVYLCCTIFVYLIMSDCAHAHVFVSYIYLWHRHTRTQNQWWCRRCCWPTGKINIIVAQIRLSNPKYTCFMSIDRVASIRPATTRKTITALRILYFGAMPVRHMISRIRPILL